MRRYFDPPKSPEDPKQFQKFFTLPVICFSAMLRVVKMDKGATDILLLVIRFYANGDPPLETM